MLIVYYTSGVTGSGHIVIGLSIYNALRRRNVGSEYKILSSTHFVELADRLGCDHIEVPLEDEKQLSKDRYQESHLYKTLLDLKPDVLIVDQFWFMLHEFIQELPCKKIFLSRQIADRTFSINIPSGRITFRPGDYDHVIATEPFKSGIEMKQINPIVIRNRNEILSREEALRRLKFVGKKKVCLFAFNGIEGEFERFQKDFSYLEDVGYNMIYSTNYSGGLFPVVDYFNAFDLIICSAGYNAFWEVTYFQKEAFFIPVPRLHESQEKRIEECQDHTFEKNGADQLVELIEKL